MAGGGVALDVPFAVEDSMGAMEEVCGQMVCTQEKEEVEEERRRRYPRLKLHRDMDGRVLSCPSPLVSRTNVPPPIRSPHYVSGTQPLSSDDRP